MKPTNLNLTLVVLFLLSFSKVSFGQDCIQNTSFEMVELGDNGDGTCDYEIDLCAIITSAPRPKSIEYIVEYDADGNGSNESSQSFVYDPPGSGIPNGTYCLSAFSPSESFIVTIPCGNSVLAKIIGYTNGSGGSGGDCAGFNAYINAGSGSLNNPLPVELKTFSASIQNENVLLEWSTASELNNDQFNVEHSLDGVNFRSITSVAGAGNSNVEAYYMHLHQSPSYGYNFYRLQQIDFDGNYEYSKVLIVRVATEGEYKVYPSLATNYTGIYLDSKTKEEIPIKIVDINGRIMKSIILERHASYITLDISDLTAGQYFIIPEDPAQKMARKKFLKISM